MVLYVYRYFLFFIKLYILCFVFTMDIKSDNKYRLIELQQMI